jgi:hypothetical protein
MAELVIEKGKKEVAPTQKGEVKRGGVEFERMFDRFDQMMGDWWGRPFSSLMHVRGLFFTGTGRRSL